MKKTLFKIHFLVYNITMFLDVCYDNVKYRIVFFPFLTCWAHKYSQSKYFIFVSLHSAVNVWMLSKLTRWTGCVKHVILARISGPYETQVVWRITLWSSPTFERLCLNLHSDQLFSTRLPWYCGSLLLTNRNQKRKDFSWALRLLSCFQLFSNVVILANLSVVIVIACKPCIKRQQCNSLAREENFKFRQNIEDYSVIRVLHICTKLAILALLPIL